MAAISGAPFGRCLGGGFGLPSPALAFGLCLVGGILLSPSLAAALLPLTLWFVWAVVRYTGAPHAEVMLFLSNPVSGIAMAMFVVVGLVHMLLGAKVVIEDYIHREST